MNGYRSPSLEVQESNTSTLHHELYELECESGKVIHHNEAPDRHPDELFMVPDILFKKCIYQINIIIKFDVF